MQNPQSNLNELKQEQIAKIKQRRRDKILEKMPSFSLSS